MGTKKTGYSNFVPDDRFEVITWYKSDPARLHRAPVVGFATYTFDIVGGEEEEQETEIVPVTFGPELDGALTKIVEAHEPGSVLSEVVRCGTPPSHWFMKELVEHHVCGKYGFFINADCRAHVFVGELQGPWTDPNDVDEDCDTFDGNGERCPCTCFESMFAGTASVR